jgi:predicted ATPase
MFLSHLGIDEFRPKGETVAIFVGPNGSGKSNYLRRIAAHYRHDRHVVVVSNTTHDRFAGMRAVERMSAGRSGHSPKSVVKNAIAIVLDEPSSRFYQMNATLEYCGYLPRFGFRVVGLKRYSTRHRSMDFDIDPGDYDRAIHFLESYTKQIIWIDPTGEILDYSRGLDFAAVLRNEKILRAEGRLRQIEVFLERRDRQVIELTKASSGELALISSLMFLITAAHDDPLVLIDEPENSLHPSWQREYIEKILTALSYRGASVLIATHAPLIVIGALAEHSDRVKVFQIDRGVPRRLNLDTTSAATSSIEEVLWRAFEVVTPANHYVSEEIAEAISDYDKGKVEKRTVVGLIDRLDEESFDARQKEFFVAVRELVDKVERRKNGSDEDDDGESGAVSADE